MYKHFLYNMNILLMCTVLVRVLRPTNSIMLNKLNV